MMTAEPSAANAMTTGSAAATRSFSAAMERRRNLLLTVDKLHVRLRQVLKCVINLHIEFLVIESNVSQLLDDVRSLNDEFLEVQRLDTLIATLRDYDGPTICHEWPYPLIFKGTIDEANVAQILNTNNNHKNNNNLELSKHDASYEEYGIGMTQT